jgi:hypothetical protein
MRKPRFTEQRIVGMLEELTPGVKAAALCSKRGDSSAKV